MKRLLLSLLISLTVYFNTFSQLGTEFWFAPPNVTEYHNPPNFPIYLLITASDQPADVTVSQPANGGFVPINVSLAAFQSQRIDLTARRNMLETRPTNTIVNTGLYISATNPISAYYEVANTNNNEIYALKGANGLGQEFYIPMHKDVNFYNHRYTNLPVDYAIASFDIVASENNTNVLIYSPVLVDGHAANQQFTITLNAGQTYSCGTTALTPAQGAPMVDYYQNPLYHPAGAIVLSDKPVAITYKDDSNHDVPAGGCYDLIGDQIVPVGICGTDYIAVKGGLSNVGRESVIITATQNNTLVYLNGNPTPYATLFAGETYQVIIDSLSASVNNAIYVNTSKPAYATHITGFGCELGSAILPPLNCAGSSRVSFVRSTAEGFFITLLVKTSAINDFTVTGPGTASINPANFKIVPGTGGLWSAIYINWTPLADVPVDATVTISNSSELFALGLINGGAATGCRYGYFSEFVAKIFVEAGINQTICAGKTVTLSGSVTGGTTSGLWTTSGDGTFDNPSSMTAEYTPGFNDILNGTVTLTLTSSSACFPESDNMIVTITPAPSANAGSDISVCSNNPVVNLNGSISYALGGIWSGGAGVFNPNNTTLNATYTPTAAEISSGSLVLTLTTTGNGICDPSSSNITITFTPSPTVNPGPAQTVCANNPDVTLNGSVTVATGGIWTGGTGSFNPGNNALSCIYTPSPGEISAGVVNLLLTTTGNGNCNAVSAPLVINITAAPTANAGVDQTKCANNPGAALNGSISVATGAVWTGGLGLFTPDNTTLNATYSPTAGEISNGFVNLTLTTTGNGNCNAVSDNMVITYTSSPTANAGVDQTVCSNNPAVTLNGSVTVATGGIWSGGAGNFSPDNTNLSAVYTPTAGEISSGSLTLTLTTTGNGSCNAVTDQMNITFSASPTVNAGTDQSLCANNPVASINATITVATGIIWTGGSGVYNPGNTALSCTYTPTFGEISSGSVTLTATTTGNGTCNAVSDDIIINFTPAPTADAGTDQTKCANNSNAVLNGSITTATGAVWSGGLGLFTPNNTTLNATYTPTAGEISNGFVNLTLTTTGNGNCNAVSDNMVITYTSSPTANAGVDQTVCSNNPAVTLNGSVTVATGGIWSGGAGNFSPDNTNLSAVYTPTAGEISSGSLTLTLTTTGNGSCNAVTDQMNITFSASPTVNAGTDQSLCANNPVASINATITVATGIIWTGGSGVYNPGNTALSCTYTPTSGEISSGSVTLTATTTGNGTCNAVSDDIIINFTPAPTADAGTDQTKCANNSNAVLNGSITTATGAVWSGGLGLFTPNNTTLNATYTPTAGEISNGFVNLTLTTTGNGNCLAVSDNVVINFTTAPTADAGIDRSVCANNPNVALSGSVTIAGGGIWSGGTGTFFPGANDLNATYTPGAADITAGFVNLTLTTTGNGNCNAASDGMTITFTPAPVVNAGIDVSACINNSSVTLSGSVLGATGGAWSGGAGTFNPSNLALNATYIPTGAELLAGNVTLTLNSTGNGNCNPVSDQITITYTQSPVVSAGVDQTKCANNASTVLNGTVSGATGGQWSGGLGVFVPNAQTLNATYVPSAGEISSGNITLTLTTTGNGNCNAETDNMTIFFTQAPTADAGLDRSVCANNSQLALSGSVTIAGGGIWSGGTGTFSPSNTDLNAQYTPSSAEINAGTATLILTTTGNGNCSAVNDNMTITITPAPVVNAGSNSVSCSNNVTVSLSGSVQNAGGGVWSGGLGVFNPSNTALNATYTPTAAEIAAGNVTLTLTSTFNGNCLSENDNMSINIVSAPVVNAGSDQSRCANNATFNLIGSVLGATGGQWSGGLGQFLPNPNTLNVTYIPTAGEIASGTLTLTLTSTGNGSCNPVTDNVDIIFTPAPTVDAGPDKVVCANNPDVSITGSFTVSSGIIWTGGNGVYSPNNTSVNITYTPSAAEIAAGFVTLTLTTTGNGNCIAESDALTIFISPAPQVSAGLDITACQNNPNATLNGIVLNASGGIWSGGLGTFIPSNTALNAQYIPTAAEIAAGEVILTLTTTGNGTCLPASDNVKITYNPSPVANANVDQTVCANNNIVVLNGQVQNAGGGIWSGGLGIFAPNNSILNASYTPSQSEINNGVAILILTTTGNGSCLAESDTVQIFYSPAPQVNAGIDFNVCNNNPTAQLNGSVTVAGGGMWSGGAGTFIPDATTLNAQYIPTQSEILAGQFTLTLTSTGNGNCNAESDQVQISVTQAPIVVAGQDQTICVDALTVNLNGFVGGITNTGQWSSAGTGSFVPSPDVLNPTYIASPADSAAGFVNLILTSTGNGLCNPVTDTLLVTILPAGYANAGTDLTVCANNAVVFLNGQVSGGAASGYWTTTGSGVFIPNNQALNASYIPSANDTALQTVYLILTANSCNVAKDTLTLTITPAPHVDAGNNQIVCIDALDIQLNGSIFGGTVTGVWITSGTGTFTPDNTTLNAIYNASSQDSINQQVTLILLSTNNGNCLSVSDTMQINILPAGIVNAGFDQVYCANNSDVPLNGSVSGGATQAQWSTSGTGTFIPNNTTLNATYLPSQADLNTGIVTLALVATDACNFAMDIIQINFSPAPTADAGSNLSLCSNNATVNINASVTIATGGIWSSTGTGVFLPDNTSLTVQYMPSPNDILSGNIDIILTTTGNGMCNPVKDTVNITFTPSPLVNAGINQTVCLTAGSTNLSGNVTGGASQGVWTTTGDGTFSPSDSILSPDYTFGPNDILTGFTDLVLTSTDNGNCTAVSDTVRIIYGSSVFVSAGVSQDICATQLIVSLNGFVAGGSTTGIWSTSGTGSFVPDNTSLNAAYLWSQQDSISGSVEISLTSTNNGGCLPGYDTILVTIKTPSSVNTGPNQNICTTGTFATVSASISGGASSGVWATSGDGSFSPSNDTTVADYYFGINDLSNGFTYLSFTTTDHGACPSATDSLLINYWLPDVVDAGTDQNICATSATISVNGSVTGGVNTGAWSTSGTGYFLPDNTTLNATYYLSYDDSVAGSVSLILVSTNNLGCTASADSVYITVYPIPIVTAVNDLSVCTGADTIQISGNITNATGCIWTTSGSGVFAPSDTLLNLAYLPSQADFVSGQVTLTLTSTGALYCPDISDDMNITFSIPLLPGFAHTTPCTGNAVQFTDLTQVISGTITNWLWTFDGANPDFNTNPLFSFTADGNHNVTLQVTSSLGCSYSLSENVFVNPLPNVLFNSNITCYKDSVIFTDNSTVSAGSINNWLWDFGNGNTSLLQNSAFLFDSAGTYQVILTVTTDSSCSSFYNGTVTIPGLPDADFSFSYNCQLHEATFTDLSQPNGNNISAWLWDFGNGNSSGLQNPSAQYGSTGNYTVTLTINPSANCSDTVTGIISVYDINANFGFTDDCVYNSYNFTDLSQLSQGQITIWQWDFGDGNFSSLQNPVHNYTLAGNYNVTLIAGSSDGCSDTVTLAASPYAVPDAGFIVTSGELITGTPVVFTDNSSGGVQSWFWDFGDNFGTSTNVNASYTYTYPGSFIVSQVVTSNNGCSDTAIQAIVITETDEAYPPVLPSAFTPNNDSSNDTLYVRGGPFTEIEFRVYNEWGLLLFTSDDANTGWNGTFNGADQPTGVYVYTVRAKVVNGREYKISGDVTLIR